MTRRFLSHSREERAAAKRRFLEALASKLDALRPDPKGTTVSVSAEVGNRNECATRPS